MSQAFGPGDFQDDDRDDRDDDLGDRDDTRDDDKPSLDTFSSLVDDGAYGD